MTTAVLTIWTESLDGCLLEESARRHSIPLMVTQRGKPWVNFSHNKIDLFFAGVRGLPVERVLYADGSDAVFVRPDVVAVAGAALAACDRDFLVGGEVACWPWPGRHGPRHPAGSGARYPNAGCWVATRDGFVREFAAMRAAKADDDGYAETWSTRQTCDQPLFHDAAIAGTMAVDRDSRLVLNLNGLGWPDSQALWRIVQPDAPAILHGPGRAKSQVRRVWRQFCRLDELTMGDAAPGLKGLGDLLKGLPPMERAAAVGGRDTAAIEVLALLTTQVSVIGQELTSHDLRPVTDRYAHVTLTRAESATAASRFLGGHFDLVYLGGTSPSETAVLREWLPKVRPGGWVVGVGSPDTSRTKPNVLGPPQRARPDHPWVARVREQEPDAIVVTADAPLPTLSVIIPTVGRPSLARALASIAAQGDLSGVEVILALDGPCPDAEKMFDAAGVPGYCVELPGPHRDWGHTPSNLAAPQARHQYLMRLDDDNAYLPGAFQAVRTALAENPGRPHVFRIRRGPPHRDVLWSTPEIRSGNVDAQMFVVPNVSGRVGRWGSRYEGDFDFIRDTAVRYPDGAVVWRADAIAVWRPGELRFPADVAGWLSGAEAQALHALATGSRALEVGTYAGRSAVAMAQSATVVLCIDPFDGRATPAPRDTLAEFLANAQRYGVADRVRPLVGTAATVGRSLADAAFDLVFVDGDHARLAVEGDLALARRVLAAGGRVAVHDYCNPDHPGVAAAVDASGLIVEAVVDSLAVCRVPGNHSRALL